MMSRFPAAFRPPAFASWSSCARQGTGPSLRSAYRSLLPGPDPDEVATFRAHELRPGWVPSLPRGLRCPHGRQVIPGRRTPPCSGPSLYPRPQPTTGGFLSRGIIKGSLSFTRPAFPWPVAPGWSGSPRACPPGLHTPPLPAAHAGVGTGIVGTCLSYVTISWSSTQRSHSPRATSCRTDLIRACALHLERPIPVLSANQQYSGRNTTRNPRTAATEMSSDPLDKHKSIVRRGIRTMCAPGVDDRGSRTVPAGERGRVPAALAPPDRTAGDGGLSPPPRPAAASGGGSWPVRAGA